MIRLRLMVIAINTSVKIRSSTNWLERKHKPATNDINEITQGRATSANQRGQEIPLYSVNIAHLQTINASAPQLANVTQQIPKIPFENSELVESLSKRSKMLLMRAITSVTMNTVLRASIKVTYDSRKMRMRRELSFEVLLGPSRFVATKYPGQLGGRTDYL